MSEGCIFCEIVRGTALASVVYQDDLTRAFIDLRQFHPGHTLVIPRQHFNDVRDLDSATGAALMATVSRVARAVAATFPKQDLSIWHSIGEAAFQAVPHLHIHIHPRLLGDGLLQVYPRPPLTPDKNVLDRHAAALRAYLQRREPPDGQPERRETHE